MDRCRNKSNFQSFVSLARSDNWFMKKDIDNWVKGGLRAQEFWAVADLVVFLKVRGTGYGEVSFSMFSKSIVSIRCLAIKGNNSKIATRKREIKR